MREIAVITGGTSGIGKATALCLRDAGYDVYELSRREQGVEGLHHIRCDITDEDQVRAGRGGDHGPGRAHRRAGE